MQKAEIVFNSQFWSTSDENTIPENLLGRNINFNGKFNLKITASVVST
jgi:hypothetical protein